MHVDAAALTAAGGVLSRQQAHLDAARRYVEVVCDRPAAFVGVLAIFRGAYADAVAASTRGLADAARLAHGLEGAVCAFRDDVLEVDAGTAARLARTERLLHGTGTGPGPAGSGGPVGLDGSGRPGGAPGVPGAVWAGPASASIGGPRPSTGLARVLSAHVVAEAAGAGPPAAPAPGVDGADRPPSSARSTLDAARGLQEQVGELRDALRGVGASLGETGHGLADLDTYTAFATGNHVPSAADLADRLGAPA